MISPPPIQPSPPRRHGGHLVVTSSLGRDLDTKRLLPRTNSERVTIRSMSGGKIEDAHKVVSNTAFENTSVSILIGTNNIGSGESSTICFTKYKEMVATVLETQPDASVNLIELPRRLDHPKRNTVIEDLNNKIRSLCESDSRLHFTSLPIEPSDLDRDGLHLNPSGTHKLVIAIRKAVIPDYIPPPRRTRTPSSSYYGQTTAAPRWPLERSQGFSPYPPPPQVTSPTHFSPKVDAPSNMMADGRVITSPTPNMDELMTCVLLKLLNKP